MFVRNIKEFKKKTNKKKIICLDCGKKRVGIAISDENHKVSMPMQVIKRDKEFNRKIENIFQSPFRLQSFANFKHFSDPG